jgi:hypothetical protein
MSSEPTDDVIFTIDERLRGWSTGTRWAPGTLTLPRLVVLVGPNGAGKSALMGTIYRRLMAGRPCGREMADQIVNYGRLVSSRGHTLAEMLADPRFVLVAIDGVDQGFHLTRQYDVMKQIMDALKDRPELRVLCTCYSPYALERVPGRSVFVVARAPDGVRHVKQLTDAPGFARWSRGLTTGELWATYGEDWTFAPPVGVEGETSNEQNEQAEKAEGVQDGRDDV